MAHPACNFIRHTLTIFLPLLFRARMPKRGDSCKRKVAGAGLDLHRNKFIFAQIVIPLFFHAVMNFHSFLDGHQLHPRCPALRPSPYSPLASRSSFIFLTLHTDFFISQSCLITHMEQCVIPGTSYVSKHASARISYGFSLSLFLPLPSSLLFMRTCSSLRFILSGFPVF